MNKTKSKKKLSNKKALHIAIVISSVVLALIVFWLLVRNDSYFTHDKDQLGAKLETIMNTTSLPGQVVDFDLKDNGCQTTERHIFSSITTCGFEGYKVFSTDQDIKTSLGAAEQVFVSSGFKPFYGHYRDGEAAGKDGEIRIELMTSQKSERGYYLMNELIQESQVQLPSTGYLYGFKISAVYYSCVKSGLFEPPCPPPLHESKDSL